MIYGAHFLLSSTNADADRIFLRDVLGFRAVDAGDGWLILMRRPRTGRVGHCPAIPLPSGGALGLHQPLHPTALAP